MIIRTNSNRMEPNSNSLPKQNNLNFCVNNSQNNMSQVTTAINNNNLNVNAQNSILIVNPNKNIPDNNDKCNSP